MKTKKEFIAEIKWELVLGKYMPYYLEYLAMVKSSVQLCLCETIAPSSMEVGSKI
jgi:hypothetical protein